LKHQISICPSVHRSTSSTHLQLHATAARIYCLDITDSDGRARGRDTRECLAVLLDVDDVRAAGAGRARGSLRGRAGEGDGAKVGEGHERGALLEVLDDPLSVLLAERRRGRDLLRDGLALRVVGDHGRAGRGARRGDGERDGVAGAEADTGEVVGVVGVPLVPGWKCAAQHEEAI
jgi:hypothetical protein